MQTSSIPSYPATVAAMEVHAVAHLELCPDHATVAATEVRAVAYLQLPGKVLVVRIVSPLRALLMNLPQSPI
jgi:hypothetical protein